MIAPSHPPASVTVQGSTRHLARGEDYDYFCDVVAPVYVGVRPDRPAGVFAADFALYDFGATGYGVLTTPPVSAQRDRSAIARLSDDALFLNFSRAPWVVEHLGRRWTVPGGVPFLLDNSMPFRIVVDPRRTLRLHSLRIPRGLLAREDVVRIDERVRATAAGAVLAAQAGLLATVVEEGRLAAAPAMSDAVVALLDAVDSSEDAPSADRLRVAQVSARERLGDPTYSVDALARAMGCSPRTVQSVFAAHGQTFAAWLRDERLQHARALLVDPAWQGRTIAAVAAASGFADVSAFHRAFRARFGCTPSSLR
nr:AraC family transcriptional regulator [Microbacterium lemovicicum]